MTGYHINYSISGLSGMVLPNYQWTGTGYHNNNYNYYVPSYNSIYDPYRDLEKFLSQYDLPDFEKSFEIYEIYTEQNKTSTPKESFIAAMKIGFSIAKLRNNDKKETLQSSYWQTWTTGITLCITGSITGNYANIYNVCGT